MKKTAIVLTLALTCCSFALAKEGTAAAAKAAPTAKATATSKAASAKARKAAAAETAVVEQFINLQDAAIATFLELGDTLQGVRDKKSADAAAPTVKMAGEQLYTIISAVEALGDPSEAAQQAIMARIANVAEKNEIVEQVMVPMLTLMMQQPPCYGSEALQTELSNLLANLQGAAGIEEDEVEEVEANLPLQEPDADEAGMQQ